MTTENTVGAQLTALRQRAGLSLQSTAIAAGYRNGSSIQRYFDTSYDPFFLPVAVAKRLVDALVGKGDPPIEESEIFGLSGLSSEYLTAARETTPQADEFFSVAVTEWEFDKTLAPEWASFRAPYMVGQRLYRLNRPRHLYGQGGLAYVVTNDLMSPRYNPGEIIVTVKQVPSNIGDHVVIFGRGVDSDLGDRGAVIYGRIGRLLHRSEQKLELEQYNPAERFVVPREEVTGMHRILEASALLGWPD